MTKSNSGSVLLINSILKIFLAQFVDWYLRRLSGRNMKVGILGGGQLGRMLLQAAANYPVETFVMENDANCPSAHLCHHFFHGNIQNYEEVYHFGRDLDAITIE